MRALDLKRFAAIFVADDCAPTAVCRLSADPDLAWRMRIVVDLSRTVPARIAAHIRAHAVPLLFLEHEEDCDCGTADLWGLLFYDPVVRHLTPTLELACHPAQVAVFEHFLGSCGRHRIREVARSLGRSPRSLIRDHERLGLNPPGMLDRVARLSRGLTWAHLQGAGLRKAALVAEYSTESSFRRAAHNAFPVPAGELARCWGDPAILAWHFRAALLRQQGCVDSGHNRHG